MCFIAGIVSPNYIKPGLLYEFIDSVKQALLYRGRDAIGAVVLTGDCVTEIRRPIDKEEDVAIVLNRVLSTPEYVRGVFLQTRAVPEAEFATAGNLLKNVQPFYREGWITSHTGTIANFEALKEKYFAGFMFDDLPEVDSFIVTLLFSKLDDLKVLQQIQGSFSIAAYNVNSSVFWLAKNFQPLYYNRIGEVVVYSSLPTKLASTVFPAYTALKFRGESVKEFSLTKDRPKSVLVCLSGGLDSAVTLRLYQALGYEVVALFFDYGQAARLLENHCTRQLCRAMKVVRYTQKLNMDAFTSPLLEDTSASTDSLTDAETTFSYVPQRNLIMAAYALGYAEQLGLGGIALGMNLSDASAYPDNGVPFLEGLNNITPYSSNWGSNLKVSAPLVNMMKSEIVKLGLYLGVPFPYVCSCYYPKLEGDLPVYCGKCGSDLLYKAAWNKLGYDPPNLGLEPTLYKSPPTVEMKDSYKVSDLPFYSVFKLNL